MENYALPTYDRYRDWINNARKDGKYWEEIQYALKGDDEHLKQFLNLQADINWCNINVEDLKNLVKLQKDAEEQTRSISIGSEQSMIVEEGEDSDVYVPTSRQSSWQLYKKKLLEQKGFKMPVVTEMEETTIRLLRRLRRDTTETKAVKGLVIGNFSPEKLPIWLHSWQWLLIGGGMFLLCFRVQLKI